MQSIPRGRGEGEFSFLLSNVVGWLDTGIAIAASRSGATGLLNCEAITDLAAIRQAVDRLVRYARGPFGIKLEADSPVALELLAGLPALDCLVLTAPEADESVSSDVLELARARSGQLLVEVNSCEQAARAAQWQIDGFVAKGQEAGGAVGEETTFILLQRLIRDFSVPVWAHGGVGLHSSAACYVAGAAGVLLDSQLLLLAESSLPSRIRAVIERIEGDETVTLGRELGSLYRLYRRPGIVSIESLQELERELSVKPGAEARAAWRAACRSRVNWQRADAFMWPLGQDSAFAAPLAARFPNVAALVRGLSESITKHVASARLLSPLAPGSALARSQGTEFPILQGPMTRVSDAAGFAAAVAEAGGLPFLALALLRGPQVRELLAETSRAAGDRPWGVGILGFVPADLRSEQLEVTREFRPPFAIIAGGRPDQAASLEREGTICYLHVPAPALLELFVRDGARRFIFEGRECGGHIGPRTSFVLWECMIEVLLRSIEGGIPGEQFHIVFAGGIHDSRSAAMVAAMGAPLAERGVRIGVLMGTAYLFSREAVECGAIVPSFQEAAMGCSHTVVLETGPGHATRCAETPFYDTFRAAKHNLVEAGKPHEAVREELEQLNLGRLRVASKGIAKNQDPSSHSRYSQVSVEDQRREGMYMIGQVAALRDRVCSIREIHEEVSIAGENYLRALPLPAAEQAPEDLGVEAPCDIAIVGMACVLPKAPDVRTFWANLLNKVDGITEIPRERFNIDLYYDPDRKARDKIYTRWGGFIDDVPFEPLRYGIPPTALGSIDPMQLLSLIVVDRALDDAGYREREFTRAKTSVIFGTSGGLGDLGGHYAVRASLAELISDPPPGLLEQLPEWTEDSFAGLLPNVAAGRVANRFNLGGVNFTIDAACASSMAAVYVAARELTTRSSDMVIVGGVDTVQSPFCFLCFSKAQALSPRGRCRPFDESADGIAISEGITVLVMKRLEDAERDGDRIYTVLKAVSGSSDGRGRSMTAPRREGQKLVLRRAYRQAGFSPATIGLMEAHGTGTVAGDTTEMDSLSEVLREAGAAEHSCAVGSVKSLVGHTKAAAGVTGLMKVALATYYKVLPPTLHVEHPNARLSEPGSALFVSGEAQPWLPPAIVPRRAGASSFGFGGTNFHAVLEEYLGDFRDPADRVAALWPSELFVWSAPSADSLKTSLEALGAGLERGALPDLHELASALSRRAAMSRSGRVRLALVASSLDDLTAKLGVVRDALAAGRDRVSQSGVYLAPAVQEPGQTAFLFPGQGSQSPAMMRDLALYFPEFREGIETADRVLDGCLPRPLSSYIYPPPPFSPEKKKEQMQAITDTLVAQPALGAIEISLARLLGRLGITPAMTGGHSYGEYVALCAAGVFSEETLFRLSEARGRAIKEATHNDAGFMVAAEAPAEAVAEAIREIDAVTIANYNSPRQTVVAGPTNQLDKLLSRLRSSGISAVQLPVACAFHSPLVAPARDRLASVLAGESFASPRIAVFSNTLGERYPENPDEIAGLLSDHLVRPVRFTDEIHAMYNQGARTFVEVGPRAVLTGLVRQILNPGDAVCIQIDTSGRHGVTSLLDALAQLFVRGVSVQTEQLFRGRSVARLDLDKLEAPVPSQWTVNGGYAYRGSDPPVPVKPVQIMRNVEVERIVEVPAATPANEAANLVPSPVPTAAPRMVSDVDTLMASFHQLMGQFLQTQAAVTMAYLQGTQGAPVVAQMPAAQMPAVVSPLPVSLPVPPPVPVPVPQAMKAAIAPSAPPLPSAPRVQQRNVLADLVRIASERTGYPVDVLDVNAAIEADLGIDSIKRVEILSSFQQLCTADEQARVQSVMEKLAPAPSLRAIAELIDEVLGTAVKSAEPAVEATAAPRDVLTDLVRIASERTGYPVEVLDVNAAIEADLGIDSIKRVEILSSFQQLCTPDEQARVQSVMEKLAPAPSLRAIAELIDAVLGKAAEPRDLPPVPVEIPRFTFTAVDCPRRGAVRHHPGRVCLVTDDETGIAAGIVDAWTQAGEKVLLLRQCSEAPLSATGVYSGDLKDPAVVNELVQAVRSQHGPIGALVHLLPLRAETALPRSSLAEWRNHLQLDLKSLYALVRACETDLRKTGESGGALIAVATGRGGAFTGNGETSSAALPAHRALADFCRTIALEIPEARCGIIDLDITDPTMILREKLLEELGSGDSVLEVGLPGDRRLTPAIQNAPLKAQRLREIQSDWVFLLTGGARGITAEVARLLAERHHPTLILVGTTPLPADEESTLTAGVADPVLLKSILMKRMRASGTSVRPADVELLMQRLLREREIRATLASLRRAGSRVEYHTVDVRDETLFGGLIDDIYRRCGRLDVVVHGAGIIEDKLIRDKVPESFDRVVHTKADSCCILAQKLRPESLQCLMLMSSVTAAFGNRGQADYGAANGVLNGFAMRLAKTWPGSVVAVNWGPWDQANMVSEHVRRQFVSGGVQIIPLAAGAEAAVREIESGGEHDSVVVLGGGPWQDKTLPARPLHRVSTAGKL